MAVKQKQKKQVKKLEKTPTKKRVAWQNFAQAVKPIKRSSKPKETSKKVNKKNLSKKVKKSAAISAKKSTKSRNNFSLNQFFATLSSRLNSNNKSVKNTKGLKTKKSKEEVLALDRLEPRTRRVGIFGNKRLNNALLVVIIIGGIIYLLFKWVVIAWVDRTPVTRIQLYKQLESRYGSELKEQLLVETLINSEAQKRGIHVSLEEINQEAKVTEDKVGGKEVLNSLLEQQKITPDDFNKQLKFQVIIRKMFGDNVQVSDQEISDYFKENQASLASNPNQTPVLDEAMKNRIREELVQQKTNQNFRTWLQETLQSERVARL